MYKPPLNNKEKPKPSKRLTKELLVKAEERMSRGYVGSIHVNVARNIALLGGSVAELARACGVTSGCAQKWLDEKEEFRNAWLEGRDVADGKVAGALFKKACGYVKKKAVIATFNGAVSDIQYVDEEVEPDVGAAKFWLSNRAKDKWGEGNDASTDVKKLIDIIGKILDNTQGNSQVKKNITLDSQTGEEV